MGRERTLVPWTGAQERLLREHYRERGARWCADQTGHTVTAVRNRVSRLGLTRPRVAFVQPSTPQIDAMIRARYCAGRIGAAKEIAAATGRDRRWVSSRAQELGLRLRGAVEAALAPEHAAYIEAHAHRTIRTLTQDLRRRFGWRGSQRHVASHLIAVRRRRDATDERMTATQVAEIFGYTLTHVTRWIKKGWLIAERLQGHQHGYRIAEADLAAFVIEHPSAITLSKLETDKDWFIDLLVRHGRVPNRQDGSMPRRIRSVVAANPGLLRAEIAALLGIDGTAVYRALQGFPSPVQVAA